MDDPPTNAPDDSPVIDVYLTQLAGDRDGPALFKVRTLGWLPWAVVVMALLLLVGIAVARAQAGINALKVETIGSLVMLLIVAAFALHKSGARKTHHEKFVFSNPQDPCAFVHFTEHALSFGVPKVFEERFAWVYFNRYTVTPGRVSLIAGGMTLHIDLSRASDEQVSAIRAGLARAFARPRIGPPLYIRHCMCCGYDLAASPGPDCPECGRTLHKHNYPNARIGD